MKAVEPWLGLGLLLLGVVVIAAVASVLASEADAEWARAVRRWVR